MCLFLLSFVLCRVAVWYNKCPLCFKTAPFNIAGHCTPLLLASFWKLYDNNCKPIFLYRFSFMQTEYPALSLADMHSFYSISHMVNCLLVSCTVISYHMCQHSILQRVLSSFQEMSYYWAAVLLWLADLASISAYSWSDALKITTPTLSTDSREQTRFTNF